VQGVGGSGTSTGPAGGCPLTWEEMVRQAASAVRVAAADGMTRQFVRVLLPRDAANADFGLFAENDGNDDSRGSSLLVPPDESWQGGIQQLYRAAAPTCEAILRQYGAAVAAGGGGSGLPPRITEDRSVDESGVDGIGLFTTDDKSVSAFVQPTQESIDVIEETAAAAAAAGKSSIVMLLNPQWRQVDDALDSASQGDGFLSNLANFLGGKGGMLKRLRTAGFVPVYTLEGYVCKGSNVRLLQVYGQEDAAARRRQEPSGESSSWSVYCERDDRETWMLVGSAPDRPTYQQVQAMLDEAGIGYKYARDVGLEPKL
jgi:Domain of unknown function (DUF1995)